MSLPRGDGFIHLADYRPPAWRIPSAELHFELGPEATEVTARLALSPDQAHPGEALELDGEELELLANSLDGLPQPPEMTGRPLVQLA